ncbi:MAG: hypothetical protein RR359_03600 [Bacilli bacterium]
MKIYIPSKYIYKYTNLKNLYGDGMDLIVNDKFLNDSNLQLGWVNIIGINDSIFGDYQYDDIDELKIDLFIAYKHMSEDNNDVKKEEKISDMLVECYNLFIELDQTHPSDIDDFVNGIHGLQKIMGMRELRRLKPNKYPTKK